MTTNKNTIQTVNTNALSSGMHLQAYLQQLRNRLPGWFIQAVKFLLVGLTNTAIDLGLYLALTRGLGIFENLEILAKGVSYSAGVLNSYYWNRSWTFRSKASALGTLIPFVLINFTGVGINTGALHITMNMLKLDEAVALIIATGITFLWNFSFSKFIIFKPQPT